VTAIPRLKVVMPATGAFMVLVALAVPLAQEFVAQAVGVVAVPLLILSVAFLVGYIAWPYSRVGAVGSPRPAGSRYRSQREGSGLDAPAVWR
jgi:hypothetical protein